VIVCFASIGDRTTPTGGLISPARVGYDQRLGPSGTPAAPPRTTAWLRAGDLEARTAELAVERTASEEGRAELAAVLAGVAEAVVVVDAAGAPLRTSPAYDALLRSDGGALAPLDASGQPLAPEATPIRRAARGETFVVAFGPATRGRGNRANGLISLHRSAPAEAAAGKNPVSHVGKIYNLLAHGAAGRVHAEVGGLEEVYIWLCSRIGAPVDQPELAAAQVVLQPGVQIEHVRSRVAAVVEDELARIAAFTQEIVAGRHAVY
jgi:S-adenosylmethionine synthetase (AdoMet synthetase)